MANVEKKDGGQQGQQGAKGQGNQPQQQRGDLVRREQPAGLSRDPFQTFMRDPLQMLARDPFQLMRELLVDPFRMFQNIGRDIPWNPGFEVRETNDAILFKADLPGMRSEDLDISLSGNQLVIAGKREQEQDEGQFHTYERTYGSFTRSFVLPEYVDIDQIHSDLKDGVLTLVAPKKPGSTPQRRKIQIGSGSRS